MSLRGIIEVKDVERGSVFIKLKIYRVKCRKYNKWSYIKIKIITIIKTENEKYNLYTVQMFGVKVVTS